MASYTGGQTEWIRQANAKSGITEDRKTYYEVTYLGRKGLQLNAFRNKWSRGDACVEPGFTHLALVLEPEIIEGNSMGWATLRFEGYATVPEADKISESSESREITLTGDSLTQAGKYSYTAPVVRRSYTQDSKRTTTKSAPTMIDPEPELLVSFVKGDTPLSPEALIASHDGGAGHWVVKVVSGFTSKTSDGSGWTHEEYHTKELSMLPP